MSGNASEWCWDSISPDLTGKASVQKATRTDVKMR